MTKEKKLKKPKAEKPKDSTDAAIMMIKALKDKVDEAYEEVLLIAER